MWHKVIATATEWENFFALRAHSAAEIHIQELAYKMLEAYNSSTPKRLNPGEWHTPFGDKFNMDTLGHIAAQSDGINENSVEQLKVKVSTARNARISYLNYEGNDDYEADIKLHDRLKDMGHWSPFEHCARVMTEEEFNTHIRGKVSYTPTGIYSPYSHNLGWSGNFRGFIQYRKMFENENKKDPRVNKL